MASGYERYIRGLGAATAIPALLLTCPLVGAAIGHGLQHLLGWGHWIVVVGVLLGLMAGMRETFLLAQRLQDEQHDD